jgi:putative polymerase
MVLSGGGRGVTSLIYQSTSDNSPTLKVVPAAIVIGAVTFNAVLAIANAHLHPLTPAVVIGVEAVLVFAAHLVALANYRPAMMQWYALLALLILVSIYRSLASEQLEIKYFRDVALIPTFIILGMTFDDRRLSQLVVIIHTIVIAGMVLEVVSTPAYAALFQIQDYYINTRGYVAADFWNKESDLYVSAMRPDSRLFAFVDLHRLSSIFLEPVSLGDYCIAVVAFVSSRFSSLSPSMVAYLGIGTIAALIGCDGRLAAGASVMIIAAAFAAPCLPRNVSALALPASISAAIILVQFGGLTDITDDFGGRIAHTIVLLKQFDVNEYLGVSTDQDLLSKAVDSGIAYLIMTQSLYAVGIIWMFITIGFRQDGLDRRRYTNAVAVYLSFTMMVSYGFLTIKTAALLWFIHGSLQVNSREPTIAPAARRWPSLMRA